jgi:hypothetical protein
MKDDKDVIIGIVQVTDADVSLLVKDKEIQRKRDVYSRRRFKRTERRNERTERRGSRKVAENK